MHARSPTPAALPPARMRHPPAQSPRTEGAVSVGSWPGHMRDGAPGDEPWTLKKLPFHTRTTENVVTVYTLKTKSKIRSLTSQAALAQELRTRPWVHRPPPSGFRACAGRDPGPPRESRRTAVRATLRAVVRAWGHVSVGLAEASAASAVRAPLAFAQHFLKFIASHFFLSERREELFPFDNPWNCSSI